MGGGARVKPLLGGAVVAPAAGEEAWAGSTWTWIAASTCLLVVVGAWVALGELLQEVQSRSSRNYFPNVLFITYVAKSSWSLGLLGFWALRGASYGRLARAAPQARRHLERVARFGALCCVPVMAISLTWYVSLKHTAVGSNTAIYNSSAAAVFVFSYFALGERASPAKVGAVVLSMVGVVLVGVSGSATKERNVNHTFGGVALVFVAMLMNSAFQVSYKAVTARAPGVEAALRALDGGAAPPVTAGYRTLEEGGGGDDDDGHAYATFEEVAPAAATGSGSPERHETGPALRRADLADSALFLGSAGAAVCLLLWPLLPLADAAGLEAFEWPPWHVWRLLLAGAALDTAMNAAALACIALTSPLFETVGSLLTVPASLVCDYLLHRYLPGPAGFFGVGLVVAGFAVLVHADYRSARATAAAATAEREDKSLRQFA